MRDALLIGPWHHQDDRSQTYRRTPNDYEAEHILLRTIRCVSGEVQTIMDCEPVLDYGRDAGALGVHRRRATTRARRERRGLRRAAHPHHRHAARLRGRAGQHAHAAQGGRRPLRRAVLGRRGAADDLRGRLPAAGLDGPPLAALAGARAVPRPPLAQLPAAQRADAQGPHLRPDRRGHRRGDAPRCPRRRAATATTTTASPGSATPPSRCGGCTPSASTGRRSTSSPSSPTSPSATRTCRSCTASAASATSRSPSSTTCPGTPTRDPVRIGNAAYAQKQHDVWGALLDSVYLHSKAADHLDNRIWPILDKQVGEALKHWREPDAGIWEVRGELRHFTSSKIMCWVAVDRGARLARMAGETRQGRGVGARRRGDQGGHPRATASTSAASSPSTTAARRWTRRCCSRRWCASCRRTTRASAPP